MVDPVHDERERLCHPRGRLIVPGLVMGAGLGGGGGGGGDLGAGALGRTGRGILSEPIESLFINLRQTRMILIVPGGVTLTGAGAGLGAGAGAPLTGPTGRGRRMVPMLIRFDNFFHQIFNVPGGEILTGAGAGFGATGAGAGLPTGRGITRVPGRGMVAFSTSLLSTEASAKTEEARARTTRAKRANRIIEECDV